MYSKHHLVISLVLGGGLVWLWPDLTTVTLPAVAVIAYAAALGVLVDLDHFLIAWVNSGRPRALLYGLSNPRILLLDQSALFADGEVSSHERLLSHVVIIGILVPALWWVDRGLGLVTGVVLYGHVLSDLVWEVYRERTVASIPRR